ncbi:MAG: dolichyl-phosphate beta-glucosyltransferase [Thermoanaerobaculia bacterium]
MSVDLSVVIPCFNEEARLGATLGKIVGYLDQRGKTYEILVIDDGSQDATVSVAEALAFEPMRVLEHGENRGKGAAVRTGVLASTGEWVLITDADLSTPIEDLERLERRSAEAEIVLGSRAVAESEIVRHQPLYRELMGKTFNVIIRSIGLVGLHDTQCGFKLFRGPVARELFECSKVDHFAFDVEVVWLAQKAGYTVVEEGVTWEDSPSSRVSPIGDSWRMLIDVLRLRFWKS